MNPLAFLFPTKQNNQNCNNNNQKKPVERKNQTYKNKNQPKKIDKNMLHELYKSDNTDSDLDDMGDFIPVQKPIQNINIQKQNTHTPPIQFNDNPIDQTSYNNLQATQQNDIYQQYVDNYNSYVQPTPTRNNLDSNSLGGGHDLNSLYNSVRNDGNYVLSINERSRGEPDMYQQVGILYQQDGKTYQLMGRRTYPGSYEWEYYVRGKDSGGMDVKYPLNRKQEIYNDEEITIDLNANPFKVKIFENENYKYIPIL